MLIHRYLHDLKDGCRRIAGYVAGLPFVLIAACVWVAEHFETRDE